MLSRLIRHVRNYGLAYVLSTLAGFISFPVLTRIFSVQDYGLMSLVSSALMLLVIIGKLGMQQAVMRYRSAVDESGPKITVRHFYSTVLLGMGTVALLVALAWSGLSQAVPLRWWGGDARIPGLMAVSAVLIFLRVLDSGLMNILRAEQRSGVNAIAVVLKRYGQLGTVLVCVVLLWPTLHGFYAGLIISEALGVVALLAVVLRGVGMGLGAFEPGLYRAMLGFGLPMIAYEVGGNILNFGDRYIINALMGAEALGGYSAAYNLCEYVQTIAIVSVTQALVPMYTRLWDEQGPAATADFLERAVHFYAVVSAGLVAAMLVGGADVLNVMASSKYGHGAAVIPWVVAGLVLDGATSILGAGLFVAKKTRTIMVGVVGSALLNIALNLLLIPVAGLVGAGAATLASYAALCVFVALAGRKHLRVRVGWMQLGKLAALAAVAFMPFAQLGQGHGLAGVLARLACGTLAYAGLLVVLDASCQALARQAWRQLALGLRQRAAASRPGAST